MTRYYRVVTDCYSGFEVQWRWWWLPIWWQADGMNTSSSLETAERFAKAHAQGVVKYLGALNCE